MATNTLSEFNVKFVIALFFRKCCYLAALTVAVILFKRDELLSMHVIAKL